MKSDLACLSTATRRRLFGARPDFVLVAAMAVALLGSMPARGAEGAAQASLADLSLEELTQVKITSVSGRPEPLSDAPASIYVITSDDIRRSGATTLPEALRLAPNLQVARLDSGQYAITARGFNNAIGNKLLVLIDGRTIYASFFSGVLWDQQDVLLDNIERIEVISGPGGTLWGTNAVNGVINVVTRNAGQTQGALAVASAGNQEKNVAFRYGAGLGSDGYVSGYVKRSLLRHTTNESGMAQTDDWERTSAGFRADWSSATDSFMLQGNASHGQTDQRGVLGTIDLGALEVSEVDVLGRWTRRFANGSDISLQAYYDHFKRDDAVLYQPREDVIDLEFKHGIPLGDHRVLWGAGYKRTQDDIKPGLFFGFVPEKSNLNWSNVFAQDEIRLGERLQLTLGARLEHNEFTGTETLPSARLAWKVGTDSLLWTAASRAVRAPARLDRDIRLPPTPPYLIAGGPDFVSEVANVYELGYRGQLARELSLSITGFYQDWDKLRSGQAPPDALVQNMIYGHTSGIEAWSTWQAAAWWRLSGGLTTLHKDLRLRPESTDPVGASNLGNDPDYEWQLRSAFDLPAHQEVDVIVRRVASLPDPAVPAYTAVDARYGWQATAAVELSLAVRNAFDGGHPEFAAAPGRSDIGRSVLLQLRWTP
jgi:iron complex outermembrane receptor protein